MTWTSPDGQTRDQIDLVAVDSRFKRDRPVSDTRSYRGADISSDHNLAVAVLQLKLCRVGRGAAVISKYRYNKLTIPAVRRKFELDLKNRFSWLMDDSVEQATVYCNEGEENTKSNIEQKTVLNETTKTTLSHKKGTGKSWISVKQEGYG